MRGWQCQAIRVLYTAKKPQSASARSIFALIGGRYELPDKVHGSRWTVVSLVLVRAGAIAQKPVAGLMLFPPLRARSLTMLASRSFTIGSCSLSSTEP